MTDEEQANFLFELGPRLGEPSTEELRAIEEMVKRGDARISIWDRALYARELGRFMRKTHWGFLKNNHVDLEKRAGKLIYSYPDICRALLRFHNAEGS